MKCLNCNKELIKGQTKYCSNKCQKEYEASQKIQAWLNGENDGLSGVALNKTIRRYLLEKHNYQCEICGWGKVNTFTGLVPLEIHHIDGDYTNNNESNLQVLCPNCHSLTPNFRNNGQGRPGRITTENRSSKKYCIDCGKEIFSTSLRCRDCEHKNRITEKPVTREELKILIRTKPFTEIGKMFKVTDNAIKKWCKTYNLPFRKKDINLYSDAEWELI